MAIKLSTTRKFASSVIGNFHEIHTKEYCFARVTVSNAASVTVDPIGQPVIWNGTDFEFYAEASDISAVATDSSLPDGSPVAVVVGTKMGAGLNNEDVTIDSDGTEVYVCFRGPALIKSAHIDWAVTDVDGVDAVASPALAAKQAAFIKQLEKQGVAEKLSAQVVTPNYIEE